MKAIMGSVDALSGIAMSVTIISRLFVKIHRKTLILLIRILEGEGLNAHKYEIPAQLIIRESTSRVDNYRD
jgi:DNA-binding LacI/PurR family transcriptional regulator